MTVLDRLACLVVTAKPGRRALVAIDGAGCSGKSTLADRLAAAIGSHRPVLRASIDDFMNPRAFRYRQGQKSARGSYEDTFDLDALRAELLDPLGPAGSGRCRIRFFDRFADHPVKPAAQVAASELLRRAHIRDVELFGDATSVEHRYRFRYLPAERLYEQEVRPVERADVVLDNTDPVAPLVRKWPG